MMCFHWLRRVFHKKDRGVNEVDLAEAGHSKLLREAGNDIKRIFRRELPAIESISKQICARNSKKGDTEETIVTLWNADENLMIKHATAERILKKEFPNYLLIRDACGLLRFAVERHHFKHELEKPEDLFYRNVPGGGVAPRYTTSSKVRKHIKTEILWATAIQIVPAIDLRTDKKEPVFICINHKGKNVEDIDFGSKTDIAIVSDLSRLPLNNWVPRI